MTFNYYDANGALLKTWDAVSSDTTYFTYGPKPAEFFLVLKTIYSALKAIHLTYGIASNAPECGGQPVLRAHLPTGAGCADWAVKEIACAWWSSVRAPIFLTRPWGRMAGRV